MTDPNPEGVLPVCLHARCRATALHDDTLCNTHRAEVMLYGRLVEPEMTTPPQGGLSPGAEAYVEAMRKVGTDQDVADAQAAAERQSAFDALSPTAHAALARAYVVVRDERDRLQEALNLVSDACFDHGCGLEGYDDACLECRAVKVLRELTT